MGKCAKRAFENGGNISKADQLIAEMNAKYGVSGNTQPAPVAVQRPAPQPQPAPQQPQQRGLVGNALGILGGRQQQIDKAAGYANGGIVRGFAFGGQTDEQEMPQTSWDRNDTSFGKSKDAPMGGSSGSAPVLNYEPLRYAAGKNLLSPEQMLGFQNGGKIQGPGTPTSDSIPARVNETGEEIRVSNGERIVSAEQGALLENMAKRMGFDSLDHMLESGTGKPVGPTIKGGKRGLSGGALISDEEKARRIASGNIAGPEWFGGNSAPTIYGNGGLPVEKSVVSGSLPVAAAPKEANPLVDGASPWYAGTSTADNRTGLEMERERRNEANSAGVLNDPVKSALQYGVVGQPDQKVSTAQVADKNYGNEGRATRGDISVPSSNRAGSQAQNPLAQVSGRNNQGIVTANSAAAAYGQDSGRTNLGTMNLAEQNERMAKSLGYAGTDDFNKQFRLRSDPVQQQAELAANGLPRYASLRQNEEVDTQLKRGQLRQQDIIAGLQDKALAGDKNALASLQELTGKNPNADRYITVQGGEEIGPDGMTKIRRPSYVFDQQTGRRVQDNGRQSIAFGDFEKAYLAKRPGTKPEQIKADYEQLYGSR